MIVRARDEADIEPLTAAGASEVVPEAFESGLMLASHTLVWVGVPLSRVMRRVSQVREERYGLLRGLFHGDATTEAKATARRAPACGDARTRRARGRPPRCDELGLDAWASKCARCAGAAPSASSSPPRPARCRRATWWCCSARRRRSPRPKSAAARSSRLQPASEKLTAYSARQTT